MTAVNVYLLSSLPLSKEMQVETGARFAGELMVGPELLLHKTFKSLRAALGSTVEIRLNVLFPRHFGLSQKFEPDLVRKLLKATDPFPFEINFLPVANHDSLTFEETFSRIGLHLQERREYRNAPVVVIPADILLDGPEVQEKFFSKSNLQRPFSFLSMDSLDPGLKVPFKEMMEASSRWTRMVDDEGTYNVADRDTTIGYPLLYTGACAFKDYITFRLFLRVLRGDLQSSRRFERQSGAVATLARDCPDSVFFKKLFNFGGDDAPARVNISSGFYDFGHQDTYLVSKLYHLSARHFNSLKIDLDRGTITKSSTASSFFAQTSWYSELLRVSDVRGVSLHSWLPSTRQILEGKGVKLEMPIIPSPSLADLLLSGSELYHWEVAAKRVAQVYTTLASCKLPDGQSTFHQACTSMYHEKTLQRWDEFYGGFHAQEIRVAVGGGYLTLEEVRKFLVEFIANRRLETPAYAATFMHGDLCFSNILFDTRSTSVKLIDPRGLFGGVSQLPLPFGDPAYDLAKLMHSFTGQYDLIVAGLLATETRENGGLLLLDQPNSTLWSLALSRLKTFEANFMATVNSQVAKKVLPKSLVDRAKDIQPLLFLSMLPLHADNPSRQRALLAKGVNLLVERLQSKEEHV